MTTIDTTKLAAAFALVCPAEHAKKLAAAGVISAESASRVSWRDRIGALVLDSELAAEGLTIADVCAAVEFYTATEATATR